MTTHSTFARSLVAVLVAALAGPAAPAAAVVPPDATALTATCATPASTNCVQSFAVAGGVPAGVTLDAYLSQQGTVVFEIQNSGNLDPYELGPELDENDVVTIVAQLSTVFTPAVVFGVAYVDDWLWDDDDPAVAPALTIIGSPRASSWTKTDPCNPVDDCPDIATDNYTAMFRLSVEDTTVTGFPAATAFLEKFTGGIASTNGQYFSMPTYDPGSNAVQFEVGAPHKKADGTMGDPNDNPLNTGFFRVLIPDPVASDLWGLTPASFTPVACGGASADVNVTVEGAPASVSMTRATGRAPLPDGWIFENCDPVGFSTPTIAIAPAQSQPQPAPAPLVEEEPTEVELPETIDEAASTLVTGLPVRLPGSGVFNRAVTLIGGFASVEIAAGTVATVVTSATAAEATASAALTDGSGRAATAAIPFTGLIRPPFAVTASPYERVNQILVSGIASAAEVRFDPPFSVRLNVPPGADADGYQAVALDTSGGPSFLTGVADAGAIYVAVDVLSGGSSRFGLSLIGAPAIAAQPLLPVDLGSGFHSRWAGQSGTAELGRGQLADVTVLLRNTGIRTWRSGTADQVVLGTNAPAGSTAAVDSGLVPTPLYNRNRLATHAEETVSPGGVGTFRFRVRAPFVAGTYRIDVRPVVEGLGWLEDEGIHLLIVVP